MPHATSITRAHITMAAIYLVVALLSLFDFILAQFGLIAPLENLYWFRLHMITIGVLAQAVMGVLPLLLARRLRVAAPTGALPWILFGLLNLGLLLLSFGQVLWNQPLRSSGGWVLLLTLSLWLAALAQMWRRAPRPRPLAAGFFLAGPSFLWLGVLMALTILEGWPSPQGYQAVKESHVHSNIFGFTGITVAGVILNVLPALFGRDLARPQWVRPIFWLMTVGAFLLWLGPYIGVILIMGGGLLLYVIGLALTLANFYLTRRGAAAVQGTHLLTSYLWVAAPAVATIAFVLFGPDQVSLTELEAGVTQGLVYGWILQIVLAFLPALSRRLLTGNGDWAAALRPEEGSRFSLILLNLSVAAVWLASILLPWDQARPIVAIAYLFLIVATLPYLRIFWQALRRVPASIPAH